MKALIVCNGAPPSDALLSQLVKESDYVVAADGGLFALEAAGLAPSLVIGDLDSYLASGRESQEKFLVKQVLDQDHTDLDKALAYALAEGAREVVVTGILGGRVSHQLSNFSSLQAVADRLVVRIEEDRLHGVLLSRPGALEEWDADLRIGSSISLFSFSGAKGVSTSGLKWDLNKAELCFGTGVSISNVVRKVQCSVSLEEGTLLVLIER